MSNPSVEPVFDRYQQQVAAIQESLNRLDGLAEALFGPRPLAAEGKEPSSGVVMRHAESLKVIAERLDRLVGVFGELTVPRTVQGPGEVRRYG